MTISDLLDVLFPPGGLYSLTTDQENIIRHPQGPAWVLAGPGSGKTEVLTIMVLRLLYVENDPAQQYRVPPESIFVTTFTEKAARNLEDRISQYRTRILTYDPSLESIDISKLRIGTLHGLCNDLLQEYRADNYQNYRLMDEFEQSMFIYEQMSIIQTPTNATDHSFWTHFDYLFTPREWQRSWSYLPNKWNATSALLKLFNRIVEDRVSVADMRAAGSEWARCADLYEEYSQHLDNEHRCDFSHLQMKFLEFLNTHVGQYFRDGRDEDGTPGIHWVLVDEYQDTNLMQEEIYLSLANRNPYNIVIVGDDDQAMYRFRGGSVECMVTFDQACNAYLGVSATSIARYPLLDNFRSHPDIVNFCNDYVTAFPSMMNPGARVPGKPAMTPRSSISGSYPAVGTLSGTNVAATAQMYAEMVHDLIANGVVSDPNQCCLLLKSTKESPQNARPYVEALRSVGLSPYNPRNKAFLEQEEVAGLLGAILAIVDPAGRCVPTSPQNIPDLVTSFQDEYTRLSAAHHQLRDYVTQCNTRLTSNPGAFLNANLQEIVYYILSLPPFDGWQADPVRRVRLAKLTALVESYSSMPVPGRPTVSKGNLRASITYPGEVVEAWNRAFYYLFIGYLSRKGLDEHEEDDVICPSGMVPIMTMHQSKGLEFPFVFVGHVNTNPRVSDSHRLETELGAFPLNPARSFPRLPENERAELDLIRQFFVAYSRAQYALVVTGTNNQLRGGRIPCGPSRTWLRSRTLPL